MGHPDSFDFLIDHQRADLKVLLIVLIDEEEGKKPYEVE